MKLTFKQWWKELRTEEGYGDMDVGEIAERAWLFSKGQENRRIAELVDARSSDEDMVNHQPLMAGYLWGLAESIRKGDA